MLFQLFFPVLASDNCWWIIQWFEKDSWFFFSSAACLNLIQADNNQSDYFIQRWNHLAVSVWLLSPCPILHLVVGRKWKIKPKDLNTILFSLFFWDLCWKLESGNWMGQEGPVSHKTALCKTEKAFKEQNFLILALEDTALCWWRLLRIELK